MPSAVALLLCFCMLKLVRRTKLKGPTAVLSECVNGNSLQLVSIPARLHDKHACIHWFNRHDHSTETISPTGHGTHQHHRTSESGMT